MIDIHSHILPGLDDGAEDWEESLAMARMAVNDGITGIIATPHHHNGRYHNEAPNVEACVEKFRFKLAEQKISLEVKAGQEIRVYRELLDDLERGGELLTLNNSRYMLLEFPSSQIPSRIEELIYELQLLHMVPIIAHPERNAHIVEKPERLGELIALGALSQVTSHALTGVFGRKIRRTALHLCRQGWVHLLASDSHRVDMRPPQLASAWEVLKRDKSLPDDIVQTMQANAEAVWHDAEIVDPVPSKHAQGKTKSRRKWFFKKT